MSKVFRAYGRVCQPASAAVAAWSWLRVIVMGAGFFAVAVAATAQVNVPGSYSVSDNGAATYSVPIAVPPGVGGMEPKLSLGYSSQAGNGPMGLGWNLGGVSMIMRCPMTLAHDGVNRAIAWDSADRYCLDGESLVAVKDPASANAPVGAYGGDGTYYATERESFSRVQSFVDPANAGGAAYFVVKTKAGLTMEYGRTADSRIEAQGRTAVREQFVRPYVTGFPKNRHLVTHMVFGRDEVTVEFTFDAEHTGPFAGYAATDAHVQVAGCGVYQYDLARRQITAARIYFDVATLLKQLIDPRYSHRLTDEGAAQAIVTMAAPTEHLDLATVIAVSQAVSGETVLDRLLDTLMQTAVTHAGAERALLILSRDAEPRIAAEATATADRVVVRLCDEHVTGDLLPDTLLGHVLRTRDSVILDDAGTLNPFSTDRYIALKQARSVFCLALTNQAQLIGAIYLEHHHAPRVFAPARTAVLKLLASQAAVCLENSRLSRDLADREARVRSLVDANIIGICTWHTDGRLFDANQEFLRIIGYSREDLVSGRLRWTDFTLPEWRERDARVMEELKRGGTALAQERELLRKDGSRVPVLAGGTLFSDTSNEGVAFVVDLTERKRAEQAAQERERESRLIVDTIPGLVAILTAAGEVDVVNRELVEYCGQQLEAMRQWGTNGTVHPEDLPHLGQVFGPAIATGTPYDFDARIRRFDGVYRWCQVRGLPLRNANGGIVRWYVVLTDIDERKRAEHALRDSERNLKLIIDTIPALAWSARTDGSAEFFNRHYLDFIGLSAEQASGWGWTAAVHPEDVRHDPSFTAAEA